MGVFNGNRVRWNHFGKKYTLRISDYEMDYADLYDVSTLIIPGVRLYPSMTLTSVGLEMREGLK